VVPTDNDIYDTASWKDNALLHPAARAAYGTTYNARSRTVATLATFKHGWAKPALHRAVRGDLRARLAHRHAHRDPVLLGRWRHAWRRRAVAAVEVARGRMGQQLHDADPQRRRHDLMKHMHRPDFNRPPEMQGKRMVVILPEGLHQGWLDARAANSSGFMKQYPADRLLATPEPQLTKKGETPSCSKSTARGS